MKIEYTTHTETKIKVLKRYGINYSKSQIEDVINNPENVEDTIKNRKIAQKGVNTDHLIRVIFEKEDNKVKVITFYPARRKRYED
jgi:hypothetical protein